MVKPIVAYAVFAIARTKGSGGTSSPNRVSIVGFLRVVLMFCASFEGGTFSYLKGADWNLRSREHGRIQQPPDRI